MDQKLRIFSLNTEYGKYSHTFLPYLESIASNFDIFCFQEVPRDAKDIRCFEDWYDSHFYEKLERVLIDFTPYYAEYVRESFGIVTFVRKTLKQKLWFEKYLFWFSETPFLDKWRWNNSTKVLSVRVEGATIMNIHGAWQPKSKKNDTEERILQSKILRKLRKWKESSTILIGDFNLNPETKSVKMLEKKYSNLIRQFDIQTTRTSAYDDASLPFADYAFVGTNFSVDSFRVNLEPVFSDHGFMELIISYPSSYA